MAYGWAVDDGAPDKREGAVAFAAQLSDRPMDEGAHMKTCPTCTLLGRPFACVGVVPTPLSARVEEWLVSRLPADIESVGGFLLRKAIGDFGYDGARARELRKGVLAAPGPYERHYGPFFRRFVVSSEQILEELFCAGDIAPSHALAILVHLGALEVDGAIPVALDAGPKLGELIEHPDQRRARTRLALEYDESDDPLHATQSLLAALYAGFVLDCDVYVIDSADAEVVPFK